MEVEQPLGDAQVANNSEGTSHVEPQDVTFEREEGPVNAKRHQIHFRRHAEPVITSYQHRYGPIRITTIFWSEDESTQNIGHFLSTTLVPGKKYHWWAETEDLMKQAEAGWINNGPENGIKITICSKNVETVERREDQQEIIRAYHEGKTNHRGVTETVKHLQRNYYWLALHETVRAYITGCEICRRSKYARDPVISQQMHTPTPQTVNEVVEVDLFTVEGQIYLTVIDRLSRLAGAWPLPNKRGKSVIEALTRHFSMTDTPTQIVMDNGREFQNAEVTSFLKTLRVDTHYTTPEHPKSHGIIERLHNTLIEHLTLLKDSRGLEGRQAMATAILAYNSSLHSTNNATPFEVFKGKVNIEALRHHNETEKRNRTERFNRTKAEDLSGKFEVGDVVYCRNRQRRHKDDIRWTGPFAIVGFLSRGRVRLRNTRMRAGNIKLRHVEELRRPTAHR